jgi:hypothetical protein
MFEADNSRFDRDRFILATGGRLTMTDVFVLVEHYTDYDASYDEVLGTFSDQDVATDYVCNVLQGELDCTDPEDADAGFLVYKSTQQPRMYYHVIKTTLNKLSDDFKARRTV